MSVAVFLRTAVATGFICLLCAHKHHVSRLQSGLSSIVNKINTTSCLVPSESRRFDSGSIPMYYINLNRSPARRKYMEATFASAGQLTRVPAVDAMAEDFGSPFGVDLNDNDTRSAFCEEQGALCGEVALSASHYRAIKMALIDNADVALIMEDDTSTMLTPFWTQTLEGVVKEADSTGPNWKIIRLQLTPEGKISRLYEQWLQNPQGAFMPHDVFIYGAAAYLIRRAAMEQITNDMSSANNRDLFDCRGRRKDTKCVSDEWLYQAFREDEVLIRLPPMFTLRLHEDSTGVRDGSKKGDDWRTTFHEQGVAESVRMCLRHVNFWRSAREILSRFECQTTKMFWPATLLQDARLPHWAVSVEE